jgi:hypothetical protein
MRSLRTSLGSQAAAALDFAWLFVEFATAHFFLDPATFYQFSESADRLLYRFTVAY